ncbi:metallophosphoesterase family protein [Allosalinactinospora lopnorensis]|uniref:metallophosphoesterase family protein n=1 Tax=Allosalinactinospora lopnorensis TaxID=1352348 RepID=UPI00069829DF|nr:metallophosphoesterase [Allosalinactinospora lopnorensis]
MRALAARVAQLRHGLVWRVTVVIIAGVLGGWLGLALGGQVVTPIGPADVDLSVSPSLRGETVVNVAPLGNLAFDTHAAPLRFEAKISEIRLAAAEEMFQNPEAINRMASSIGAEVQRGVIQLFVQAAVAAVLGAALVALALFRDWRRAAGSALSALLVFATAGGVAAATFNPSSVSEPRYTGLLAGAPQVVGSAEGAIMRFSEYQEQLAGLVGNVSRLYEVTSALPVYEDEESTIRALHVSDLHLNPAAWDVIGSLKDQFQVDLIIDSGDFTERGSTAEDAYADEIADLDIPYVWVRGSHDSMGTQRAVEAQPNAVVLDDDFEEVAGINFYGAGDPRFTPDQAADNPDSDEVAAIGARQATALRDADPPVDVAVLHDPVQARAFTGEVPLVLAGHGHRRWSELEETGTRYLVQGSTGGAGLQGLDTDEPTPYEASVLYFDAETKRLQAWDNVTLGGAGLTSAQIERQIEEDPEREITPPETPPVTPGTPGESPPTPTETPGDPG